MILTDNTTTFTTNYEDVSGVPIVNGNFDITIGGNVKSQTDSTYLKITSIFVISETEYRTTLAPILQNFSARKYYTPTYILPGKTTAEEVEVAIEGAPEIVETADQGGTTVHFVKLVMHEVLYGAA